MHVIVVTLRFLQSYHYEKISTTNRLVSTKMSLQEIRTHGKNLSKKFVKYRMPTI